MKIIRAVLTAAALIGAIGTVHAHGNDKPKHGGIVQAASELSFELVPSPEGAMLYVEDHGKPLATSGMSGKLTVLQGSQKTEAELKPAGDNKLEAKGLKLAPGTKAVAALNSASKKVITVRFAVK